MGHFTPAKKNQPSDTPRLLKVSAAVASAIFLGLLNAPAMARDIPAGPAVEASDLAKEDVEVKEDVKVKEEVEPRIPLAFPKPPAPAQTAQTAEKLPAGEAAAQPGGDGLTKRAWVKPTPEAVTTKDGRLVGGRAEPKSDAASDGEGGEGEDESLLPNIVVRMGKNPGKNTPTVKRYDDDESQVAPVERSARGRFFRGSKISEHGVKEESVRYVYVSRGGWIIRSFQPYLDRLGLEVIKTDNADLYAGFMETSRTFSYLCLLVASDDGTPKMLKAIAKAVALHREAVSHLRLQWTKKSEPLTVLFDEYVDLTFLKKVDPNVVRIPAGSLSTSEYKTLRETYPPESSDVESTPLKFFDKKDLRTDR